MTVESIRNSETPKEDLAKILDDLHENGPRRSEILEELSYFKEFYPEVFAEYEERIISALGLFYKIEDPSNLYSFVMSGFGAEHIEQYGEELTPVQASIRRATEAYQFTSISAPTSAGKSYSIRDLIASGQGDAVIVVPSRALIAEYMSAMRRKFEGDKGVMITPFVDNVFTSRDLRRVFILTPERSKDLYKIKEELNVELFFFDEAQITDEKTRGVLFDVMVRRVKKHFPDASLIFAHPFVDNPEAQFSKHEFDEERTFARSYPFGSVGKICIFQHNNENYYYFSPYQDGGHLLKNCSDFEGSFKEYALNGEHTLLVYVSKTSIYNGSFSDGFERYINNLPRVSDRLGLKIIEKIQHMLGADTETHRSKMIDLLKKGVVIHHGSIPLEVRFLIEDFIRAGYASICFATSTLAQGINMPFDIVWLENNRFSGSEGERALAFKNLIGRSGRMTIENKFDYGYVYTNNPILFSQRINSNFKLKEASLIEEHDLDDEEDDRNELIESIRNDEFDDDKNIPNSKVERLSQPGTLNNAEMFLDIIYGDDDGIRESIGGSKNEGNREVAKGCLRNIYEISLKRGLIAGEAAIFDNAIAIFFHMVQGRSFREIVGIRYSFISDRDGFNGGYAQFSQPADQLPSSKQNLYSLYEEGTEAEKVSYDAVVFDTYEYMDTVVSFSLSDVFVAAFQIYLERREDSRARKVIDLFRYGTNNATNILLMRYGFPPELIEDISNYVLSIDETGIVFYDSISEADENIKAAVEWYLP